MRPWSGQVLSSLRGGRTPCRVRTAGAERSAASRLALPPAVFAVVWLVIPLAWYGSDAIHRQSHPWTRHFVMMDATFYRGIAQYGYTGDPTKGAFFPAFPLLIRLVSYLTGGNYPITGLITSIACGTAASVAVWALADRVRGRQVADRAVLLFCVLPGAMTFALLYSEPLAIALGAAAVIESSTVRGSTTAVRSSASTPTTRLRCH